MTSDIEGAPDPDTGRFAIWIAGGLGVAAIVAYGAYQAQQRLAARDRVPAPTAVVESTTSAVTLIGNVETSAADLDVAKLRELDTELEAASARTTRPIELLQIRIARARALSVVALEASIRAGVSAGPDAKQAKSEATTAIAKARALTEALSREHVQPAKVGTIEARLDLADGHDITQLHPVVLLSDYPDQELRLAAIARPLFVSTRTAAQDPSANHQELATTLQRAEPQTGLTTALLALAHHKMGNEAKAKQALRSLLARTPGQPLATTLQTTTPAALIAAAEPLPVGETRGDAIDPLTETSGPDSMPMDVGEATPEVAPEPPAEPEPEPEPTTPEPEPATPEPEPATPKPELEPATPEPEPEPEPEPVEPKPAKPKPAKPKPKPAKPRSKPAKPKPKSSNDFETLLAEGCKLVRTGDAFEGSKLLKKAHDLKPGGSKVTMCMAQAQAKLGRDASALALVDRVLRSSPNNKKALAFAAKLEAKQGNRSAAEKLYRRLLALDPEHAAAKKFLGEE